VLLLIVIRDDALAFPSRIRKRSGLGMSANPETKGE